MSSQQNKTKLFVRGFDPEFEKEEILAVIRSIFEEYAGITYLQDTDVLLIPDRERGYGFRNFCFVSVDPQDADKAIEEMDAKLLSNGAEWTVNVAKPMERDGERRYDRPRSGGYRGGNSFGGSGNNFGGGGNNFGGGGNGFGGGGNRRRDGGRQDGARTY